MSNKILSLMGYEVEPESPIYHQTINIEPEQRKHKLPDEVLGLPVITDGSIQVGEIYAIDTGEEESYTAYAVTPNDYNNVYIPCLEIDRVEYIGNNEYRIIFKDEDNGREEE